MRAAPLITSQGFWITEGLGVARASPLDLARKCDGWPRLVGVALPGSLEASAIWNEINESAKAINSMFGVRRTVAFSRYGWEGPRARAN